MMHQKLFISEQKKKTRRVMYFYNSLSFISELIVHYQRHEFLIRYSFPFSVPITYFFCSDFSFSVSISQLLQFLFQFPILHISVQIPHSFGVTSHFLIRHPIFFFLHLPFQYPNFVCSILIPHFRLTLAGWNLCCARTASL